MVTLNTAKTTGRSWTNKDNHIGFPTRPYILKAEISEQKASAFTPQRRWRWRMCDNCDKKFEDNNHTIVCLHTVCPDCAFYTQDGVATCCFCPGLPFPAQWKPAPIFLDRKNTSMDTDPTGDGEGGIGEKSDNPWDLTAPETRVPYAPFPRRSALDELEDPEMRFWHKVQKAKYAQFSQKMGIGGWSNNVSQNADLRVMNGAVQLVIKTGNPDAALKPKKLRDPMDLDDSVWGERLKRELNNLESDMERHERSVLNVFRWGRLQRGILSYERLKDMKRFSFGSRVAQGRPSVTIAYGDALQG
jgi:hypothetical protein